VTNYCNSVDKCWRYIESRLIWSYIFIITPNQIILVKAHICAKVKKKLYTIERTKLNNTVSKCLPNKTSDLTNRHVKTMNIVLVCN